ncbi:hypothetical protein PMAYCL1PPCAC_10550, partial [Pristionchus mayeri]
LSNGDDLLQLGDHLLLGSRIKHMHARQHLSKRSEYSQRAVLEDSSNLNDGHAISEIIGCQILSLDHRLLDVEHILHIHSLRLYFDQSCSRYHR